MPATLELEAPVEQPSASASPTVNAAQEVTPPAQPQKRPKKRPGRKPKSAQPASTQAAQQSHTYTSPLAVAITKASPEAEAALGEAADKRFRPKKPMRMGQALRREGVDEHAVAETWAEVVDMLKGKTEQNSDVDKLLVEVLKECSKHLEDDNKAAGPPPVRVKLMHNVARPQRNLPPASASEPPNENPASGT